MKLFFFLIVNLIIVSHIYSTVVSNSVNSKSTTEIKTNAAAKSTTSNQVKSTNKSNLKVESTKKPKKGRKKNKRKKKIIRIKRKTFKNPIAIIKTGWLKISAKMFTKTNKFPPIILPNGKKIKIKINQTYFRLNEAYVKGSTNPNLPPSRKYFWFRLSGKHLYYSMTKNDINVLGDVPLKNIITSYASQDSKNQNNCFKVVDREGRNWKLCAKNLQLRLKWICKIKEILGYNDKQCLNPNGNVDVQAAPVIVEKTVTQPIILIPLASPKCNENWDYNSKGSDWICECSEGKEQSPINLPPRDYSIESPIHPVFQYDEILPEEKIEKDDLFAEEKKAKPLQLKLINSQLKIKYNSFGKLVTLDGAVYSAKEIVIHTPAEHTIDGKKFDMELQIVHYGKTKGDIAKQVVLSFLFEKQPGATNQFLDSLDFYNLPSPINKVRPLRDGLYIPKIFFSESDKETPMMKPFSFYTYQGSISYPPCTQRTINYVASQPIKIGTTALQLFEEALRVPDMMDSKGNIIQSPVLPQNNRKVQPLNGRSVFFYDHVKYCGPDRIKKPAKKKGHYEKIVKKQVDYFFVNGMNPSGLPGAFVVTPKEALGKK